MERIVNRMNPGRYLSPAEAAKLLGVSVKALRVYERHGLVAPLRSAADWRAYGPDEIARLHQVLALKNLGFGLGRIAEILKGPGADLAGVLALQELQLSRAREQVSGALALIKAARARLAAGETLSIEDLATLTKETIMTRKPSDEEMKEIFDPFVAKHFSQAQIAEAATRYAAPDFDPAQAQKEWDGLIAEAKTLMAVGDPASLAAVDLARRWKAQIAKFSLGNPDVERRMGEVWRDAMADPAAAPKLPLNPEIFAFVGKAAAVLKARGE